MIWIIENDKIKLNFIDELMCPDHYDYCYGRWYYGYNRTKG